MTTIGSNMLLRMLDVKKSNSAPQSIYAFSNEKVTKPADEIFEEFKEEYKNSLIEYFKQLFIKKYSQNDFENMKLITKSLLFSLIPLHNNSKCNEYYELILKI